jgi:G:T-mismatch repair DNA endonuclease (very short patch repair protein)
LTGSTKLNPWKGRNHEKNPSAAYVILKNAEMADGALSRKCPSCEKILYYKTVKGYEYSIKQSACCGSCGTKKEKIIVPDNLIRQCPACNADIKYKSKQSFRQAAKSNRNCRDCADNATRNTTQSDEWRKWRSKNYAELCEKDSAVKTAYDKLQTSRAHIGNSSKKERVLTESLAPLGFARGKLDQWYCDAINHDSKVVVELHGDWWHVKPESYHESLILKKYNGIHPLSKDTIESIRNRDSKKQSAIENLGYTYIVIWESDLKSWLSWIQNSLKKS